MATLRVIAQGRGWVQNSSADMERRGSEGEGVEAQNGNVNNIMTPMPIVMSFHQPSPSLLNYFDKVMILSEGSVVYFGSPQGIDSYTRKMDSKCLAASACLADNRSRLYAIQQCKYCTQSLGSLDYLIERLASKEPWVQEVQDTILECKESESENSDEISLDPEVEAAKWFLLWPRYTLAHNYDDSSVRRDFDMFCMCYENDEEANQGQIMEIQDVTRYTVKMSYFSQCSILLHRAIILTKRSPWATTSSLVETLLIAGIGGLCWWATRMTESNVGDVAGFMSFGTTYWFFASLFAGLTEFFPERRVIQKERNSGSYQLSTYFLSKTVANLPIRVGLPIIYVLISYPMAFHDDTVTQSSVIRFLSITGIIALSAQSGESIGLVIGTITSSMEVAMTIATTVSLSMLILGGFYKQNLTTFLEWLSSLSALKYSFDASVQVVLTSRDISCDGGLVIPACYGQTTISGNNVLQWLRVDTHPVELNVFFLFVMVIGLRFVAYLCLRFVPHRSARGY